MFMVQDSEVGRSVRDTIWAFSKLAVVRVRLLNAAAAIVYRKLQAVNGQSISNSASRPA